MTKNKVWSGQGREGNNRVILNYGPKDENGYVVPEGSIIAETDGSRPSWYAVGGSSSDVSKGTADDMSQAMLAVETFVRLSDEGKLTQSPAPTYRYYGVK